MKIIYAAVLTYMFLLPAAGVAQSAASIINKGNEAYRKGDYPSAISLYKDALRKEPGQQTARFNLANALQKQKEYAAAIEEYKKTDSKATEQIRATTAYNMGLAYIRSKQTDKAIESFTIALRLMPDDKNTRENLVKALRERQSQNRNQPQKDKQQKQHPMNKDLMEDKFNQLRNEEKSLQKKLNKKAQNGQPEKDW